MRVARADGSLATTGSYPTAEDAARIARLNGYEVAVEASSEVYQLELGFEHPQLALSA